MEQNVEARRLHFLMSAIGGYIGVYSILGRNGIFALAQTMNLIQTVVSLEEGDFLEVAMRVGAVCLFGLAVAFAAVLLRHGEQKRKKVSIAVTVLVVVCEGIIPLTVSSMAALYPVFLAMTLQWCAFRGPEVYGSSTIFSTNNLRQCVDAYVRYCRNRDMGLHEKACFFGNTLVSYHVGAAVCCIAMKTAGNVCVWFCLPLLALAWRRIRE